eukprot:824815-Prymnesium_polylepis.2
MHVRDTAAEQAHEHVSRAGPRHEARVVGGRRAGRQQAGDFRLPKVAAVESFPPGPLCDARRALTGARTIDRHPRTLELVAEAERVVARRAAQANDVPRGWQGVQPLEQEIKEGHGVRVWRWIEDEARRVIEQKKQRCRVRVGGIIVQRCVLRAPAADAAGAHRAVLVCRAAGLEGVHHLVGKCAPPAHIARQLRARGTASGHATTGRCRTRA